MALVFCIVIDGCVSHIVSTLVKFHFEKSICRMLNIRIPLFKKKINAQKQQSLISVKLHPKCALQQPNFKSFNIFAFHFKFKIYTGNETDFIAQFHYLDHSGL